jgi:hypothetical protein
MIKTLVGMTARLAFKAAAACSLSATILREVREGRAERQRKASMVRQS